MKKEELKTIIKSMIREMHDPSDGIKFTPTNKTLKRDVQQMFNVYGKTSKALFQKVKSSVENSYGKEYKNFRVYLSVDDGGVEIQVHAEPIKSVAMGGSLELRFKI
jgi:protein involved in temperature-dependent protein secretion